METETKAIRSIFIEGREWFDKSGGNSYFSARVWVNGKRELTLPIQYGYETQYDYTAVNELVKAGFIPAEYEGKPSWRLKELEIDVYSVISEVKKSKMFKIEQVA